MEVPWLLCMYFLLKVEPFHFLEADSLRKCLEYQSRISEFLNTQALFHSRDKQLKELSQIQEKGSGLEFSVEEVTGVYHLEFTIGVY